MEFEVNGRKIAQGTMGALTVIEGFDVIEDGGAGFQVVGEGLAVNQFEFESAPEAFHGGVVVAVGFAAHGGEQAGVGQGLAIIAGGVLDAPIGVEDQLSRWTVALKGQV